MKKFGKIMLSILAGIFGLCGAILISPFIVIYVLIELPIIAVESVFE